MGALPRALPSALNAPQLAACAHLTHPSPLLCPPFPLATAPFFIGLAIKEGASDLPTLLAYSVPLLYTASALSFVAAAEVRKTKQDGDRPQGA